jgi:hypothetical protein
MAGSSMRAGKCMAALMRRGVVPSPLTTVLRTRSGAGLPLGSLPPPTAPLDENDELIWDDGNPFPEPCIDDVAPMVGKYEALAWTTGGLGFFVLVGYAAAWWNRRRQCPWVPREVMLDDVQADAA